ncbi:MAG: agmatinase [Desulfobacterales bacterium]|nr:agmatinase [Desulfobacterales bacterium]
MNAAAVLVLPVCYEVAPAYGIGSREGPFHLLTASAELEDVDEQTLLHWGQVGIHTLPAIMPTPRPGSAMEEIRAAAAQCLETGKFTLFLGGDHAITIATAKAAAEKYPDVGVLQIDAHLDLRDSYNGSRFNHACVMRRVADDLHLPFVQAGIRSFSAEEAGYVKNKDLTPFFAHEIHEQDHSWMDRAISALPDKVYLTVDLDGLDPSVIPGTGTPEPGGLSYRQMAELLRRLGASGKKVVAADITELAKIPNTQVSEFTAARIAQKMLVYLV